MTTPTLATLKASLPVLVQWAIAASGGRKILETRVIHLPDAAVPDFLSAVNILVEKPVDAEQLRAIEKTYAAWLTDGIVRQVTPKA